MVGPTDGSNTLASSPTIQDPASSHSPGAWNGHDSRRISTGSSSSLSGDLNNWPGFDSNGVHLEKEQQHKVVDGFVADAPIADDDVDADIEKWSNDRSSESDDDDEGPLSSAALSRRAEIILANAKKRLNVCPSILHVSMTNL